MLKLLHVSDTHCDIKGKRNEQIKRRLDYIRENYPDHIIIHTGDIVDDGLRSQYIAIKKMLKALRYLTAPGNHDYKLAGNCYRKKSAKLYDLFFGKGKFAGKNKPVVTYMNGVMIIALDSNYESHNPLKFARGKIGFFQRRHLKKLLDGANPDIVKIIIFHHHLLWDNMLLCLTDAAELMQVIYHKVDIVMFGHKHQSQMWVDKKHKPYYILAADNFSDAETAQEIVIDSEKIEVNNIKLIEGR